MIRFNSVVIAGVLLLGLVAGCQNEDEIIETPPVAVRRKTPSPTTPQATPTATAAPASPGQANTPASPAAQQTPQAAPVAAPASPGKANTPASPVAQQTPKPPTPAQTPAGANIKQTLAKLKGYLPAAVKALQANDIATAKQYTQGFTANWNQKIIQFTVKNQSQPSYNKISAGVTSVNNAMQPATPDKAKAIAALQSLSQSVDEYTKSP
ncbi:MAG: hypothetical protein LDL41_12035 [Coleofasciculus sp. S288]|nr:hypothetical protein [Coleofasciculus sp. S288]